MKDEIALERQGYLVRCGTNRSICAFLGVKGFTGHTPSRSAEEAAAPCCKQMLFHKTGVKTQFWIYLTLYDKRKQCSNYYMILKGEHKTQLNYLKGETGATIKPKC